MLTLLDALPVFAVELFTFVVAWREGLFPWLRDKGPPRIALGALALWLAVAIFTAAFVAPDMISAIRWTAHWIVHLVFGFSIAFAWRAIPAARREGGEMVPVFLAMTAIAILSLYDASLYYALPQSIFMACAGMVASRWQPEVSRQRSSAATPAPA
jgi:uncharacterized membrane protein